MYMLLNFFRLSAPAMLGFLFSLSSVSVCDCIVCLEAEEEGGSHVRSWLVSCLFP